jgi:MFS family permease
MNQLETERVSRFSKIPRSIWALGFVSLFMDTSSELIHSLLPIFMVTTLGASITSVGVVEGIAEATALIVKIFSGTLSDYLGKRKLLALVGYGVAVASKPLFPLANTVGMVLGARFIDRIGKGIRGAPVDALLGDLAPAERRGASFGLRQALDTVGAFIGPLLAMSGMLLLANNIRLVLWIAVIPGVIALLILALAVNDPKNQVRQPNKVYFQWRDFRKFSSAYWQLVVIASVFTLARFSDAFLILKAQASGIPIALVPLVMVVMNIIYAAVAYPAGIWSDKINRKTVLLIGIVFLIVADLVLGFANHLWVLGIGLILWGLHMALTQGLLAAMVTDTAPPDLRGTAYGIFYCVSGIATLISSIVAGMLWDAHGPSYTFFAGALFTTLAFIALLTRKDWGIGAKI